MADTVQNIEQFAPLKKMIAANGDILAGDQESGDIGFFGLVDTFLAFVEKNGIPEGFTWADVKAVIIAKFDEVTKKFETERPIASLAAVPNVDNYTFDEYRVRILEHLNRFEESPFTLERICELLRDPRKHYDRGDKFLRAFEKCVTVTSTNGASESAMNGNHTNGHNETDNKVGTNGHTTNGDNQMETDAPVHGTNGDEKSTESSGHTVTDGAVESSVSGTDSSVAAELAETEVVPEEKKVEETPSAVPAQEAVAAPSETLVEASVGCESAVTTNAEVKDAVEEDKQSHKRPNEDGAEEDSIAKKIARTENGSVNGATHAVVGEPEVEPHNDEPMKKAGEGNTHDIGDTETKNEMDIAPVVEEAV